MAKGAQAGMPVPLWGLTQRLMRGWAESLAAGWVVANFAGRRAALVGWRKTHRQECLCHCGKALVRERVEGPRHRPIPVCRVQNCEKPRGVATRGRSGVRGCDGRIFPGDGRCGGRGWRGCCEQRSPSLRVVRGPRGASSGCKAEVRRRGVRRSSWGRTARRSARRFRRGRRIRSVRAGDQRRARWRRGNRE